MEGLPKLYTLAKEVGNGTNKLLFGANDVICTELSRADAVVSNKFYIAGNLVCRLTGAEKKDGKLVRVKDCLGLGKKFLNVFTFQVHENGRDCNHMHFDLVAVQTTNEIRYSKDTLLAIQNFAQIEETQYETGIFYIMFEPLGNRWGYGITFRDELRRLSEYRKWSPHVTTWRTWKLKWPKGLIAKYETCLRNALLAFRDVEDRSDTRLEWFRGDPAILIRISEELMEYFHYEKAGPEADMITEDPF
jgi:hypothetical protein